MARSRLGKWSAAWEQRVVDDGDPYLRDSVRHILRYRIAGTRQTTSSSALYRAAVRAGLSHAAATAWVRSAGAVSAWPGESVNRIPACEGVTGLDRFVIRCEVEVARLLALGPAKDHAVATAPVPAASPPKQPLHVLSVSQAKRAKASRTTRERKGKAKSKGVVAPQPNRSRGARLADLISESNQRAAATAAKRPLRAPAKTGALVPPKPGHGGLEPSRDHPDRPRGWETTDWINSKS